MLSDKAVQELEEELVQLNRKLQVFTMQNERQTKEIAQLRTENATLHAKLGETNVIKDWFESELDTACRQLVAMSISKKKADTKLAMQAETSDKDEGEADVDKGTGADDDTSTNKEISKMNKVSTWKRLRSKSQSLTHPRRKEVTDLVKASSS